MDELPLQERLARDVAFHRAAQLLADACRCKAGMSPAPLSQLPRPDAQWYRQQSRQLIEIFETETQAAPRNTAAAERRAQDQQARAFENEMLRMRTRARLTATARGHALGSWLPGPVQVADETAACTTCGRAAHLVAVDMSPLRIEAVGAALGEGCLVAVTPEAR